MKADRLPSPHSAARPKQGTFYPPKYNATVAALVKLGVGRDIRRKLKVTEVCVSPDSMERLRRLRGQRCLVTPSHSGGFEPHIIMHLSKLLGDGFYYLAAMELPWPGSRRPASSTMTWTGRCGLSPSTMATSPSR
jgi:hypothetical protein